MVMGLSHPLRPTEGSAQLDLISWYRSSLCSSSISASRTSLVPAGSPILSSGYIFRTYIVEYMGAIRIHSMPKDAFVPKCFKILLPSTARRELMGSGVWPSNNPWTSSPVSGVYSTFLVYLGLCLNVRRLASRAPYLNLDVVGSTTYLLIWPSDGVMKMEDVRGVYDGSFFYKAAAARRSRNHWVWYHNWGLIRRSSYIQVSEVWNPTCLYIVIRHVSVYCPIPFIVFI